MASLYDSDKKGNQLNTRFPALTDLVFICDPVDGTMYKCTAQDLSMIMASAGSFSFVGTVAQTTYQNNTLIGINTVLVVVERAVATAGAGLDQYTFNNITGTVTFNQTVQGQNVSIYYFA